MYKEGIKIQASELRELLRIGATNGIASLDYYNGMHDLYTGVVDPKTKELPQRPSGPSLDLASKETKNALRNVMASLRHNMGYSAKRIDTNGS